MSERAGTSACLLALQGRCVRGRARPSYIGSSKASDPRAAAQLATLCVVRVFMDAVICRKMPHERDPHGARGESWSGATLVPIVQGVQNQKLYRWRERHMNCLHLHAA